MRPPLSPARRGAASRHCWHWRATPPARRVLDLGCGAGRTAFDLAARHPEALVLGIDVNLALLRLAHGAARGRISYPRRRIGLVYDRRAFAVDLPGAARVDFWACDAAALPVEPGTADLITALNLLDCVAGPGGAARGPRRGAAPGRAAAARHAL